jgi:hypothetical protein
MCGESGGRTRTIASACSKVVGTRRILVDWRPEVQGQQDERGDEVGEGVREDVDDEIET